MKHRHKKLARFKSILAETVQSNPEARLVKNRYRLIRKALMAEYPKTLGTVDKDTILELLRDVTYLDREVRLFTEGSDQEIKDLLSADKITELKS